MYEAETNNMIQIFTLYDGTPTIQILSSNLFIFMCKNNLLNFLCVCV